MKAQNSARIVRFGPFAANLTLGELRRNGYRIRLQQKPIQVLELLLERPGELITREELHERLWSANAFFDYDHNLNNAVNRLRQALNDSPEEPRYIETVPRRGYRFIGTVDSSLVQPSLEPNLNSDPMDGLTVERSEFIPESHENPPTLPSPMASTGLVSVLAHTKKRYFLLSLYLASGVTILTLLVLFFSLARRDHGMGTSRPPQTMVIADVLNATGDPLFDDILKRAVATDLSTVPFLRLVSGDQIKSILDLMRLPLDTRLSSDVARMVCLRAGAKGFVVPSIALLGKEYLIQINIMSCQSGDSLAQRRINVANKERVFIQLTTLLNQINGSLTESLALVPEYRPNLEPVTTSSLEALKLYSMAIATSSDNEAIPLFKRAIAIDPSFAAAYDSLGIAYSNANEPGLAVENISTAFRLQEQVSDREKFRITADYHQVVTGQLEKANQTCRLWAQINPNDHYPHNLMGVNYQFFGKYQMAVTETKTALHLKPESSFLYSNLMEDFEALEDYTSAKAAYQESLGVKRDQVFLHVDRYGIAFVENDLGEMARQMTWAEGRAGAEDWMLSTESDTEAYHGRLEKARELSRRAIDLAVREGDVETAALWELNAASHEAEVQNRSLVKDYVAAALKIAPSRDVRILAALNLARAGYVADSMKMEREIAAQYPVNTMIQFYWLPSIRAAVELEGGHPQKAVEILAEAREYELGSPNPELGSGRFLYPVYLRAEAYLHNLQPKQAAEEFQSILSHRGLVLNCPLGALATLGMARAHAMSGDKERALREYEQFLALWRTADPTLPLLSKVKNEVASLRPHD